MSVIYTGILSITATKKKKNGCTSNKMLITMLGFHDKWLLLKFV